MKQVKNIKLFLIVSIILTLLSIIITYLSDTLFTNSCQDFLSIIPLQKCINMKFDASYIWELYIITSFSIFILFVKIVSYQIINKLLIFKNFLSNNKNK